MSQSSFTQKEIPVADFSVFFQNLVQGNLSLSKIHLAVHQTLDKMPAEQKDIFFIAPRGLGGTFKLIENCVITKPEFIHQVLHQYETSHHLHKAASAQAFRKEWALGPAGIPIVPTQEKHQILRELVEPFFKKSRIDSYKDILVRLVDKAAESWQAIADTGQSIDLYPQLQDITRNFIINAIAHDNPLTESEMYIFTKFLEDVIGYFVLRTVFPERLLKDEQLWGYKHVRELSSEADTIIFKLIHHYETLIDSNSAPDDMLSYLLSASRTRDDFTKQDLRDVIIALFLAGYETTAKTLSSAIFELGKNPDAVAKLQTELKDCMAKQGSSAIAPQDIQQLSYLKAISHETLRLWAAPWALQRTSLEGDLLLTDDEKQITYAVPNGVQVIISTWSLHRDKRYYEDAEVFKPDRWLGGMKSKPSDAVYMPFGGGVRDCVGSGIAWLEINYLLARIFQDYTIEVVNPEKIEFSVRANTIGPSGLPLRFYKNKVD